MESSSRTTSPPFLIRLRSKLAVGSSRVLGHRLTEKARRFFHFLTWVYPRLGERISLKRATDRRLLVIYDISSQPFSIGDILLFQEVALVLREKEQLNEVDFALVYDPQHPTCNDHALSSITEENLLYHLASVLPAAQTNQHLGSLFVFNSHHQLQRYIRQNAEKYLVWPSAMQLAGRKYLYYDIFNKLLPDHFKEYGALPHLGCRKFLAEWAQAFYAEHVSPHVPVTVQARNNKKVGTHKNVQLDCWLEFFRYCEGHYPVTFVVIGSRNEVDERLRGLPNVIIAKDHLTSLEQDLALIHEAAIHMGASSGPGMLATFSEKPYLLVNSDLIVERYVDIIREPEAAAVRLFFSTPFQRLTLGAESTELLIKEFERMWATVDVQKWTALGGLKGSRPKEALTWLR